MLPPVFKLQSSTQYLSLLVSASFALLVDNLLDAAVVFLLTDAMFLSVPAVSAHARAVVLAIVMLSLPLLVYVESSCEGGNVEFNISSINNECTAVRTILGAGHHIFTVADCIRIATHLDTMRTIFLLMTSSVFLRLHTLRASLFIAFDMHSAADSIF